MMYMFNFSKAYFCSTCAVKCSKTVPTKNLIEMKTKETHFSLFYFHSNYVVERPDATALARDKQYCGNGDSLKLLVIGKWWKQALFIQIFDFFLQENKQT